MLTIYSDKLLLKCIPSINALSNYIHAGVRLYLQQAEESITNFLMLRANQIQSTGSPTGALWCQSANNDTHNGTWFQPPGSIPPGYTVVPINDSMDPTNIHCGSQ